MSDLIRLASGIVTAHTLLNTSSYLVTNFPRQTDMTASVSWTATQPENGVQQQVRTGAEIGSGGYYGKVSGVIEFFILTEDMRQYLHNTIMGGKPIASVTAYLHHPVDGFQVYQGELLSPYAANAETSYTRVNDDYYSNNQYLFRRGTKVELSVWQLNDDSVWTWNDDSVITLANE